MRVLPPLFMVDVCSNEVKWVASLISGHGPNFPEGLHFRVSIGNQKINCTCNDKNLLLKLILNQNKLILFSGLFTLFRN